jgi:hypothetical protein
MRLIVRQIMRLISLGIIAVLTGCASIVNGQNQPISVSTGQVKGATCALQNNKGKWFVPSTPGSVTVQRSYQDLNVACEKKGYKSANQKVASKTKGMAFGNVLLGGVIGAGVDMADGAAYDYPNEINLKLSRKAYA